MRGLDQSERMAYRQRAVRPMIPSNLRGPYFPGRDATWAQDRQLSVEQRMAYKLEHFRSTTDGWTRQTKVCTSA